ncbi:MAG: type III pantothenate kinase [Lysobacterales bacterium]
MPSDQRTLLMDLGNTRLKWCALSDANGSLTGVHAIPHADADFRSALRAGLQSQLWQRIWIASVGPPDVHARIERACHELLPGVPIGYARSLAKCGGLHNGYDTPSQLGVDRFLSLLAASEHWPQQRVLIASIGSAVTVDLLEPDGRHAGGLIAPSSWAMRSALAGLAPQLAVADVQAGTAFARDTASGIASGCTLAVVGLIEHCMRVAAHGSAPVLVLSGGGAAALAPSLPIASTVLPYLALSGLASYARLHPMDDHQEFSHSVRGDHMPVERFEP